MLYLAILQLDGDSASFRRALQLASQKPLLLIRHPHPLLSCPLLRLGVILDTQPVAAPRHAQRSERISHGYVGQHWLGPVLQQAIFCLKRTTSSRFFFSTRGCLMAVESFDDSFYPHLVCRNSAADIKTLIVLATRADTFKM